METFENILSTIDTFVWGLPLIALILIGGIFLTIRLRALQFPWLPRALRYTFSNEKGADGEITSFAAMCTAMSATVGTGNIVGIATAVVTGGPGALFWMWMAALFGMATKFSEGLLAVKYRTMDKSGHVLGGPFYYIENGMGPEVEMAREGVRLLRHVRRTVRHWHVHAGELYFQRRSGLLRSQQRLHGERAAHRR